jgi:hypothetical protein
MPMHFSKYGILSVNGRVNINVLFRCGSKTLLSGLGFTVACLRQPLARVITIQVLTRVLRRSVEEPVLGCDALLKAFNA